MSEFETNDVELDDAIKDTTTADADATTDSGVDDSQEQSSLTGRMAHLAATLPVIGANDASTEESATGSAAEPVAPSITLDGEKPRRQLLPTFLLILLVLAGAAYVAGVVASMRYFLPNTTINGKDVSLKSIDEVARENADSAQEFSFTVTGDGVDVQVKASDIKASYDGGSFARTAIKQQNPWAWPMEALDTNELTVESRLKYDAARLDDIVGSAIDAANKKAEKPKDAKVSFNKKTGRYVVTPEKLGSTIDRTYAIKQVRTAMQEEQASVTLGEDALVHPEVTSDDKTLNAAVDEVNGCLSATQDIVMRDETVATVDEDQLREWVKLGKDLKISFDDKACTEWAQGPLSEKLDTCGGTHSYTRPDGKKVTVSGGTYGWIIDGADVASQVAENVRAGKASTVQVSFKQEAATWNPGGQEWGDKYIDIDLSEQHMRYYDGKKIIIECDCVTGGLDNRGVMHATPTGVYFINSNMRSGNIKLTGEIDPQTKKPIYISYVDYWMPFIGDSHALHDADWRSSFGGEIYKTSGSHGCVNLPVDVAKKLYGMVSVGTVVVVHD